MNDAQTSSLAQQIKKTQAFFAPDNLAQLLIQYEGRTVLLLIDQQAEFCDPDHREKRGNAETVEVATRIQTVLPAFRQAAIPVYPVYMQPQHGDDIGFFKFTPEKEDMLIEKTSDSAFTGTYLEEVLRWGEKGLVLVAGFNQAACVAQTVFGSLDAGFKTCVITDLTGNGNNRKGRPLSDDIRQDCMEEMAAEGAILTDAPTLISKLRF